MATKEFDIKMKVSGGKKALNDIDSTTKALGRAAAEQDKLEKGSANIGKNSTANFAKMSQGLGGLVHVYATVAANVFAVSSAFQVLRQNADVGIMIRAADQLSASTGISYGSVAKSIKEVTGGAIAMHEALRSASIGISSGLSNMQMTELAEVATKAANALGRSVPEAINRMTQAVVKNEPELVDEYGIILRVDSALREYADTLGKTKSELTSYDKQMAIHQQLITQGTNKFGNVDSQVNAYSQLSASFSEMADGFLYFLNSTLGLESFVKTLTETSGLLEALSAIFAAGIFKKAIPEVTNMSHALDTQNREYAELLELKTEQMDNNNLLVGASKTNTTMFEANDKSRTKMFNKAIKAVNFDILEDEFGKRVANGIKSGSDKALKDASEKFLSDPAFNKRLLGRLDEADVQGVNNVTKAVKTLRKEEGLRVGQAQVLTSYYTVVGEKAKASELNAERLGVAEKLRLTDLQKATIEMQRQTTLRKLLGSEARRAGLEGGFAGGGLAKANSIITEKQNNGENFNVLEKSAIKFQGILGNISGIAGGIMSLLSGWGTALFIAGTLLVPLAKFLKLSSESATNARDAIEESNKSLEKLRDTAEEINAKGFEDFQGYIDNLTASTNNFNEQLNGLVGNFRNIEALDKLTFLDKLFSDNNTDSISAATNKNISDFKALAASSGIEIDIDFEKIYADNISITRELQKQEKAIKVMREAYDRLNSSGENTALIEAQISIRAEKINKLLKERRVIENELTEDLKNKLQIDRDRVDVAARAVKAIQNLASAQTKATAEFGKNTPYYERIKNLRDINKEILQEESTLESINALAQEYADKTGNRLMTSKEFAEHIKNELTITSKAANDALANAVKQQQVKNKIAALDKNGSIEHLKQQIMYNNQLLDLEEAILRVKIDTISTNMMGQSAAVMGAGFLEIQKILATIDGLRNKTKDDNKAINVGLTGRQIILKRELAVMKEQSSLTSDRLKVAKDAGDITKTFELERLKMDEKHAENMKQIKILQADPDVKNRVVNTAKITALNEKNVMLLERKAQLYSDIRRDIAIEQVEVKTGLAEQGKLLAALGEVDTIQLHNTETFLKAEEHALKMRGFALEIKDIENKGLSASLEGQKIAEKELEQAKELADYKEMQLEASRKAFELAKANASLLDDPQEFSKLLGKEFANISKDFNASTMNAVERSADAILRTTDSAVDALFSAIAAGEDVTEAISQAVLDTVTSIAKDYFTETLDGLVRDALGGGNTQEVQLLTQIATNTAGMKTNIAGGIDLSQSTQSTLEEAGITAANMTTKQLGRTTEVLVTNADTNTDTTISSSNNMFTILIQAIQALASSSISGVPTAVSGVGSFISGIFGNPGVASEFGTIPGSEQTAMLAAQQFAKGGIVSSPTTFANGAGLMGEAGPEAIMPLTRSNGVLGVQATGGETIVNVNNFGNSDVSTSETRNANGSKTIDIMIEEKVNDAIQNGSLDKRMGNVYGLSRRGY